MICRNVVPLIPLWAGGDLEGDELARVENHLSRCPECRAKADRAAHAVNVLHSDDAATPQFFHDSGILWPSIARKVSAAERRSAFNPWIPALAIGAAVLLVLTTIGTPQSYDDLYHSPGKYKQPTTPAGIAEPPTFDTSVPYDEPRWHDSIEPNRPWHTGDHSAIHIDGLTGQKSGSR